MSELFLEIVNRSIAASWIVIAVLILRFCLKKAPKWVNVLLWGIVAVRLIFPFSIESALSLIPSAETVSPSIMMETAPSVQTGVPALDQVINPVIDHSLSPAPGASANPLQIWISVLTVIWLLGVAALFLYSAVSYRRLRRRVCEAVILRDNIYQSENVCSPFVLGIIRPKIYLPYHMDKREMDHVIAHEQTHIRRGDHWWKPLGFLLLTVHWFNPLLWLGYILLCRDIELACDEKVIREMGNEQRADYTQALVSCSVSRRSIAACPLAFGEVGIKERVKSVMNYKKPAFWIILASALICAAAAVCFLTNPKTEQIPPSGGDNVSDMGPAQTEKWFDYLENPEEMNWDGRLEIDLPEYPGVTFRCYPEKMEAVTENEITPLYTGMPIWNTYFCDLTGDGLPDLCSTVTFGSGIIDSRIIVCDYANGESYTLEDRGKYDYSLRLDGSDGSLCVVQRAHDSGDIAAVGELSFSDSGLHLQVIKTNFETHKFTSVTIRNDGEDTLHITIGSDETALPTGEETTLTYAAFEVRTIRLSSFGELSYTVAYD
mgnify:CR=1 FL=1